MVAVVAQGAREPVVAFTSGAADEVEDAVRLRSDEVVDVAALFQGHGAGGHARGLDELEHPEVIGAAQVGQGQHRDGGRGHVSGARS